MIPFICFAVSSIIGVFCIVNETATRGHTDTRTHGRRDMGHTHTHTHASTHAHTQTRTQTRTRNDMWTHGP